MEEGIGAKGREEGIKGAEGRLGEDEDENGEQEWSKVLEQRGPVRRGTKNLRR